MCRKNGALCAVLMSQPKYREKEIYHVKSTGFYNRRVNDRGGGHWRVGGNFHSIIQRLHFAIESFRSNPINGGDAHSDAGIFGNVGAVACDRHHRRKNEG